MNVGDYVEIKEAVGSEWKWTERFGHITGADRHCFAVRADDGEDIRDVREHFRPADLQRGE